MFITNQLFLADLRVPRCNRSGMSFQRRRLLGTDIFGIAGDMNVLTVEDDGSLRLTELLYPFSCLRRYQGLIQNIVRMTRSDENCCVMTRGDGFLTIDDTIMPETAKQKHMSSIPTAGQIERLVETAHISFRLGAYSLLALSDPNMRQQTHFQLSVRNKFSALGGFSEGNNARFENLGDRFASNEVSFLFSFVGGLGSNAWDKVEEPAQEPRLGSGLPDVIWETRVLETGNLSIPQIQKPRVDGIAAYFQP
ncbi:hypothetical protein EV421DRAFT_1734531 [Armillaria borealis]|uniref:Uncharacterized protein n=1 Tax=Armillaria borealis TaxID=47425 RepID=A0AA39JN93_9AGAR|nr:hypothetical protein EV421DRAFT_1734531 [Armillaria borealis]